MFSPILVKIGSFLASYLISAMSGQKGFDMACISLSSFLARKPKDLNLCMLDHFWADVKTSSKVLVWMP